MCDNTHTCSWSLYWSFLGLAGFASDPQWCCKQDCWRHVHFLTAWKHRLKITAVWKAEWCWCCLSDDVTCRIAWRTWSCRLHESRRFHGTSFVRHFAVRCRTQ